MSSSFMEPWLSTIQKGQTSVWSSWNGSFLWSACSWTIWSTLQKHFKCQKGTAFPKVPGNPKFMSFVNVTQSQFLLQSGTSCIYKYYELCSYGKLQCCCLLSCFNLFLHWFKVNLPSYWNNNWQHQLQNIYIVWKNVYLVFYQRYLRGRRP